jgi:hypothetical protein
MIYNIIKGDINNMKDENKENTDDYALDDLIKPDYKKNETFIKYYNFNIELLLFRLRKLESLLPPHKDNNVKMEFYTYFDMIIVQARALLIENINNVNNYTYQNYLKLINKDKNIALIDEILNSPFINDKYLKCESNNLSIKNAIKILSDKIICHYDEMNDDRSSLSDFISCQLSQINNDSVNNIKKILFSIFIQ